MFTADSPLRLSARRFGAYQPRPSFALANRRERRDVAKRDQPGERS
jgi:hypothetical protein